MLPPARGEHAEESCSFFRTSRWLSKQRVRTRTGSKPMQVIHECCAALDVHKKTVVTTIMKTQADGSVQEWTRTFLTMTADLLALDDWLRSHDVEVIAMESTGVFWRPVFNLLEEGRQVILVNAEPHESSTRPQDRRQGQSCDPFSLNSWITRGRLARKEP